MLGKDVFQRLSAAEFEELQRQGRDHRRRKASTPISFNSEVRANLNTTLAAMCMTEEFDAAGGVGARVAREAGMLLETLRAMQTGTHAGVRVALWSLFSDPSLATGADLKRPPKAQLARSDMRELVQMLEVLCDAAKSLERLGKAPLSKRAWLDSFIIVVAEAFAAAGGNVAAGRQSARGYRESPFLRIVKLIHRRLPEERQAETDGALESRAARIIPLWNALKKR